MSPVYRAGTGRGPRAGEPPEGRAVAGAEVVVAPASAQLPASPLQTCTTTPAAAQGQGHQINTNLQPDAVRHKVLYSSNTFDSVIRKADTVHKQVAVDICRLIK